MRLGPSVGLILALTAALAWAAPAARFLDRFVWRMEAPWFGGWSGLELSADGRSMVAITDRGVILRARVVRDAGRITGIDQTRVSRLRASTGKRLSGRIHDSEGLALLPGGVAVISFEGVHRLARYDRDRAAATPLPRPPVVRDLPVNGGFEALAVDGAGRLYALPEDHLTPEGAIPVYRWDGTRWSQPFTLEKRGRFLPVGADFGPDGRFYLLERAVGFIGFKTRLRRWSLNGDRPDGEETLLQTGTGTHDNLEGLAIWRDAGGTLRATMIADDNFAPFQTTEIVEYALPD